MYFVYVLESTSNKAYYIGCTSSIERRLKEHNNGLSKYTKGKGPWVLKYSEIHASLSQARQREKQIKSWKKRVAVERLIRAPFV